MFIGFWDSFGAFFEEEFERLLGEQFEPFGTKLEEPPFEAIVKEGTLMFEKFGATFEGSFERNEV